jgi:uncharacterized protein with PQ loop repeat
MIESIGWLGSSLFMVCSITQAIHTTKTNSAKDLSWIFLLTWFSALFFSMVYMVLDQSKFISSVFWNYFVSLACVYLIIRVKLKTDRITETKGNL